MLKHGRFMQNLQVTPIYPKIVEAAVEEDDIDRGSNNEEEEEE